MTISTMIVRCSLGMFIASGFFLSTRSNAQDHDEQKSSIQPNAEIQAHINRALEIVQKINDGKYVDQFFDEIRLLKRSARGDDVELVRQLALASTKLSNAEHALFLLKFIELLEISDLTVVKALAPHLDAENDRLKSFAGDCVAGIDAGTWKPDRPLEPVNYKIFQGYIAGQAKQNKAVPEPFVLWIFRLPGHALLAFLYGTEGPQPQQREVLWAEHVVSDAIWRKENGFVAEFENVKADAISALHKLTINRNWWARLYVAEIIRRHPELRTDSLVERLRGDENEPVRRVAMEEPTR